MVLTMAYWPKKARNKIAFAYQIRKQASTSKYCYCRYTVFESTSTVNPEVNNEI